LTKVIYNVKNFTGSRGFLSVIPSVLLLMNVYVGVIFFASLSFDSGLSGVIVETHPGFWALLAITLYYAFKVQKRNYLTSVFLLYVCGLGIRLLVAFHTLYPGSGPWWELGSVHSIVSNGFNLKGGYYHSGMPVLQFLILLLGGVFGTYLTTVFIIPVLAWTLTYSTFYIFFRKHLPPEITILALFLVMTANILFESTLRAETIAIPIGVLVIHILLGRDLQVSKIELMLVVGLYALLTLTHHLTSAVVLAILAALVISEEFFHHHISKNLVTIFLLSGIIFFSYWGFYQGFLSEKLAEISLSRSIESMLETPWPKPIWWWALYSMPKVLSVSLIAYLIIDVLRYFREKTPIENQLGSISSVGVFVNALSAIMPGGYLFLRVFHQFFGYHTLGISTLPRSKILLKILAVSFLFGMIADFPIMDSNNYVIGGLWFNHSSSEVEGAEFLAMQIPDGSRIAIDGRVEPLIYIFVPRGKVVPKIESAVYAFDSTEEAWNYSIVRSYDYIFVSDFYETMFVFKDGSGATQFSENQLNKFSDPFFTEVFGNGEVSVYKVNGEIEE